MNDIQNPYSPNTIVTNVSNEMLLQALFELDTRIDDPNSSTTNILNINSNITVTAEFALESQYNDIQNAIHSFAPQYSFTDRSEALIPYATRMTAVDCYGDLANDAIALRVCHMMALEERNGGNGTSSGDGTSGSLKSEKEGDLARSYSNAVSDNDTSGVWGTLPSTTYGQMLIEMAQGSFMTVRNRFSGNC